MGVGFTSCGLLPDGFPDSVAGVCDCIVGLNAIGPDCFSLVDEKALENEKALAGGFPGVPDEGVADVKGMVCFVLANERVPAAVLGGFPDAGVPDGKELDCFALENVKPTGEGFSGSQVEEPDAVGNVCLPLENAKTPTGRFPAIPGVDETLPLRPEPGSEEGPTFPGVLLDEGPEVKL